MIENKKNSKCELRFNNGKFRILSISDLHGVANFDRRITRDLSALIDAYNPDLILILGDVVWGDAAENADTLRAYVGEIVAYAEQKHIPWAQTFGNHDAERGYTVSEQQSVYEEFEYNVSSRSPKEVHGTSNYVLPIKSSDGTKIVYNVWMLDSGRDMREYLTDNGLPNDYRQILMEDPLHNSGTYDAIRFSQIKWYWEQSIRFEQQNGAKVPGLMCFHIPVPEYQILYKNVAETHYRGLRREHIGCSPVNSGLFSALVERGDIKTVIAGHDHINDFEGTYLGIKLTYDAGLSYDGYCDEDMRGGRIVDIDENNPWFVNTYMVRAMDYVKDYPGKEERE